MTIKHILQLLIFKNMILFFFYLINLFDKLVWFCFVLFFLLVLNSFNEIITGLWQMYRSFHIILIISVNIVPLPNRYASIFAGSY